VNAAERITALGGQYEPDPDLRNTEQVPLLEQRRSLMAMKIKTWFGAL